MAGRNCCLPQCHYSDYKPKRAVKEELKLFVVTSNKSPFYSKWREDIVKVIAKYRELDSQFYKRLALGHIWICEKHFAPEDIELNSKFMFIISPGGGRLPSHLWWHVRPKVEGKGTKLQVKRGKHSAFRVLF